MDMKGIVKAIKRARAILELASNWQEEADISSTVALVLRKDHIMVE